MASAFSCDICTSLEAGAPAQKLTVIPSLGQPQPLELCTACLMSFNQWRDERTPADDADTADRYS